MWDHVNANNDSVIDAIVLEIEDKFGKIELEEKKVLVRCPACGSVGSIHVCKEVVHSTRDRNYDYPVASGVVCEHAFMVQIDANMKAR